MAIKIVTSKIRGGQVTPVMGSCTGTGVPVTFIVQTFGVETTTTDVLDATTKFLKSSDFQGQKEGNHDLLPFQKTTYASASYSSTGLLNTEGDLVYNGREVHISGYDDNEDIG